MEKRPQLQKDPAFGWRVVGEPHQLPVGELVRVSIPGAKGGGSRLIKVERHEHHYVDDATGKVLVVATQATKEKDSSPITNRPINDPSSLKRRVRVEMQRSRDRRPPRRGPCDECGRVAVLVDVGGYRMCRPCSRDAA